MEEEGGTAFPHGSRVMFTGPYGVSENGAYSEWLALRMGNLCLIPDNIDDVSAAGVPVAYPGSLFEVLATTVQSCWCLLASSRLWRSGSNGRRSRNSWQEDLRQILEAYLVTEQNAVEGLSADNVLQDFAGELHLRCDSPQGGLLLPRPDAYIGFGGQFGATLTLTEYLRKTLL